MFVTSFFQDEKQYAGKKYIQKYEIGKLSKMSVIRTVTTWPVALLCGKVKDWYQYRNED